MKKLLTLVLALVIAFSAFGLVACENNAGDGTESGCQHSVGADGVCTLCGKDILAKWKTVFDDAEKYKGFSEEEAVLLETYMKRELTKLKKMASSVNVLGAFMK